MKKLLILLLFIPFVSFCQINDQDFNITFSDISKYPTEFSQANIVSRMIEGLGYRYYWASKSLSETDLEYKSSEDARSTLEIIKHIYSLTNMISSSFKNQQYEFSDVSYGYKELREKTLLNLKYIHEQLKLNPDFSKLKIRFERGGNMMEFPFWNQINGPISDALWHCGQVVMNRRASGNPLQSGVNVFIGKTSGSN
tara:strand:+ start:62 stop:652 length:591 start_codon:yes stop_codon:yes gene_type:complete